MTGHHAVIVVRIDGGTDIVRQGIIARICHRPEVRLNHNEANILSSAVAASDFGPFKGEGDAYLVGTVE